MIRPILNLRMDGASTIPATGTLTAASGSTVDLSLATVTLPASITSTFFDFKGNQSASGNPNYPAGSKGDVYYISVAGKVGGASGKTVTVGDMLICSADNAGGTEASVGTSWFVTESNLDMTNVAITGGTITGTTVSGVTFSGSGSLANSGTSSLTGFTGSGTSSGTNTGDQTSVTGNAGTATALATARNIFNISFNGTANVAGDATNTGHFASIPGTGAAGHFVSENGTAPTLIAGRSAWYSDGSGVPSFKNGTGTAVTLVRSSDIGVSVQAYDADLTTWAGITPGANVGTFLATPSGANLASALTSALPESKGGTAFTSMVKFHAYKTADQTTTGGSYEQITFPSEEFDTGSNFASSAFTAPVAGKYIFGCTLLSTSVSVAVNLALYKNGSQIKRLDSKVTSSVGIQLQGSVIVSLAANDVITIYSYTATAATYVGAQSIAYFWGQLLPGG